MLADKLEMRFDKAKGYMAGISSFLGALVITVIFIIQIPFGASLALLFFVFIFGECWTSPVIAMINVSLPHNIQGIANGVMSLSGSLLGSVLNLFMGAMLTHYDSDNTHPELIGVAMGSIVSICYLISIPFLVLSSHYYVPFIKKIRQMRERGL